MAVKKIKIPKKIKTPTRVITVKNVKKLAKPRKNKKVG